MKKYEINLSNEHPLTIALTMEDAKKCYHEGICDADLDEVCKQEYVKSQMKSRSRNDFVTILNEYGLEYEETDTTEELFGLCVWLAAEGILDDGGDCVSAKIIED